MTNLSNPAARSQTGYLRRLAGPFAGSCCLETGKINGWQPRSRKASSTALSRGGSSSWWNRWPRQRQSEEPNRRKTSNCRPREMARGAFQTFRRVTGDDCRRLTEGEEVVEMPAGMRVRAQVVPDAVSDAGHPRTNVDVTSARKSETPEPAHS